MNLSSLTDEEIEMIQEVVSDYRDFDPLGYRLKRNELGNLSDKLFKIVYGEDS